MLRKLLTLLAVALLMPTLGGCFLFSSAPAPDPVLPVTVPRECQRIARKVPDPGAKVGVDLGDIAAGYRAAYLKANNRIGAVRTCEDHQADAIERGAK